MNGIISTLMEVRKEWYLEGGKATTWTIKNMMRILKKMRFKKKIIRMK